MSKVDDILEAEADKQAAIDEDVENNAEEYAAFFRELLVEVDQRDPEIFEQFGADPELTTDSFEVIPVVERGPEWAQLMSAMFAAAQMQAFLEVFGVEFLGRVEARNKPIDAMSRRMSTGELIQAGEKGFGKEQIKAARDRRAAARAAEAELPGGR